MTPREELIGAWTALDVTVAHMHQTVDDIRRCMGFIPHAEPDTKSERARINETARSLSVCARKAIAWGADDATCTALAAECRALIHDAAAVTDQHRRSINHRFNGLRVVEGGKTT